jgi:hypothetical protein
MFGQKGTARGEGGNIKGPAKIPLHDDDMSRDRDALRETLH